jgi:hypothetical protein
VTASPSPTAALRAVRPKPAGPDPRRRERLFYCGMAVAAAATVFAGFAKTYFLRSYFTQTPLMPLLHVHGLVLTTWFVLFLTQTFLVAARRTDIHRRLGVFGAVVAVLVAVIGVTTAVIRAKQGAAPPGVPPLVFLVIPLGDMLLFSGLVGSGLALRRRTAAHKRLILLGTIALLPAAIARLPHVIEGGPPAFFGLTDLFVVACVVYDRVARGRIHPATAWGGAILVASQPLRLWIGGTDIWLTFAKWVTGGA